MVPGVPLRQTTEYKRNGISNLYAALDIASGKVITNMTDAHRAIEFISILGAHRQERTQVLTVMKTCTLTDT